MRLSIYERCVYQVSDHTGFHFGQCSRRRGHGPNGRYCKQHGKMRDASISMQQATERRARENEPEAVTVTADEPNTVARDCKRGHLARALIFAAFLTAMCGCSGMSNDAVIAEVRKCQQAGMRAEIVREGWQFKIVRVECVPLEDCK